MSSSMIDNIIFTRFRMSLESQGLFRIIFALFIASLKLLSVPATELASVDPDFLLKPTGIFSYISTPPYFVLSGLNYLLMACILLLLLGFYTKTSSLLIFLISIFIAGLKCSLGKIDHHILFLIVPGCMFFSRWGYAYSLDSLLRKKEVDSESLSDGWPFGFLAICIAYGMFTSGVQKVLGGWLVTSSHATLGWMTYLGEAWERPSLAYSNIDLLMTFGPLGFELMDWFPVMFDLLFPITLLNKKLFRTFCCFAVFFHIGTWLLVDIYFPNQTLVYAAFFNWQSILDFTRSKLAPSILRLCGGLVIAISIVGICQGKSFRMSIFMILACLFSSGWLLKESSFLFRSISRSRS